MPEQRTKLWAQFVSAGSADIMFDSFPSDAELASKMNEFLPGEGVISEDHIRRERERYHKLPRRGDVREEKFASPTKNVIRNKAEQLNVREALAEIIDNIFDNYERENTSLRPKKLEIEITVYGHMDDINEGGGELIVKENSGGIPYERVVPLIQLGYSDKVSGSIGAWGEGFKMAVFALGQEVEIFSHVSNENPVCIYFPKGWLEPNDNLRWKEWKVNTHAIARNPPPKGTTIIRVSSLHRKTMEYFSLRSKNETDITSTICADIAAYFGRIYAEKYHNLVANGFDIGMTVRIGTAEKQVRFLPRVHERLKGSLAFLPWLRPIHWHREFISALDGDNRTARLQLEIFAGLAATQDYLSQGETLSRPGVEMWGNGRLFSLKGRITDESVGWGYVFGGGAGRNPASNASTRRIAIVALFTADDSMDIPWAAPVKNDYNRRSEFYAEIRDCFARVIRLFKDAVSVLEVVLLPFSAEWSKLDVTNKLQVLFGDISTQQEQLEQFSKSRFGTKLLNYQPNLTFKELDESIEQPTVYTLYGVQPTLIQGIVSAAAGSRNSFDDRVAFLKVLFQPLCVKAALEEQMELALDEELELR